MTKVVTPTRHYSLFDTLPTYPTDSGDVICIQGRDLSTDHLLILFIRPWSRLGLVQFFETENLDRDSGIVSAMSGPEPFETYT